LKANPTIGFQYEEITIAVDKDDKAIGGFWDVGGNEACMAVMQAITQNISFKAIIFVIDITKEIKTKYGGIKGQNVMNKLTNPQNNIDKARIHIHRLMAEEECRSVHTLAIVFNCRNNSAVYKEIMDSDPKTSLYLKE